MNKIIKTLNPLGFTLALFICGHSAYSQNVKLGIGGAIPELRYSKWIKGTPIKSFDQDHLYILEFWATWCGPCKAVMPHITELQEKYKGKATFIGVGVMENVPEGKPYDSSLPSVVRYVEDNDASMGYSIIADNNKRYMANKWLRAAGENGIPSTFIVKENKVIWIGHPNSLHTVIPEILEGKYNMEDFKTKWERNLEARMVSAAKSAEMTAPINKAIKAKKFAKALKLMDKIISEKPNMRQSIRIMKLNVLLSDKNKSLKDIQIFANEWQAEDMLAASSILSVVYQRPNLSKETYLWAATNMGNSTEQTNPFILDAVATCYAKAGDFISAIAYQENALTIIIKALEIGSIAGSIADNTIIEYEVKLKKYRKSTI